MVAFEKGAKYAHCALLRPGSEQDFCEDISLGLKLRNLPPFPSLVVKVSDSAQNMPDKAIAVHRID